MAEREAMGLYRSLYTELPCEACGRARQVEVQFKTGDDYLQQYSVGDFVDTDDGFLSNAVHRGIADRYCENCYPRWAGDSAETTANILAECIDRGWLQMTHRDRGVIAAEQVRAEGEERARQLRVRAKPGGPYLISFGDRNIEFRWHGQHAKFWNDAWDAMTSHVRKEADSRMVQAGWAGGDQQFHEDLGVYLDDERRIHVRVVATDEPHNS